MSGVAGVRAETATVYRCPDGRRFFTIRAALRRVAWERIRETRCECEDGEPEVGFRGWTCPYHGCGCVYKEPSDVFDDDPPVHLCELHEDGNLDRAPIGPRLADRYARRFGRAKYWSKAP